MLAIVVLWIGRNLVNLNLSILFASEHIIDDMVLLRSLC